MCLEKGWKALRHFCSEPFIIACLLVFPFFHHAVRAGSGQKSGPCPTLGIHQLIDGVGWDFVFFFIYGVSLILSNKHCVTTFTVANNRNGTQASLHPTMG